MGNEIESENTLAQIEGEAVIWNGGDVFQGIRHARYFVPGVPYHVIFRTFHGAFLMRPDVHHKLRETIGGVIGRALGEVFPEIEVHALSVLSNHGHMAFSSEDPSRMGQFVGYLKREISNRWGPVVDWKEGIFGERYCAAALLTEKSQERALEYILAQGVKENLVEDPTHWPGFHCAKSLMTGEAVKARWFDGTAYGRAKQIEERKPPQRRQKLNKADFWRDYSFQFSPMPAFADLAPEDYQALVQGLVAKIIQEGKERKAKGEHFMGIAGVLRQDTREKPELPDQPWFEDRRRMIVWDDFRDPKVKSYLRAYWDFQQAFRLAADRLKDGDMAVDFPPGAYRPGIARAVPYSAPPGYHATG